MPLEFVDRDFNNSVIRSYGYDTQHYRRKCYKITFNADTNSFECWFLMPACKIPPTIKNKDKRGWSFWLFSGEFNTISSMEEAKQIIQEHYKNTYK